MKPRLLTFLPFLAFIALAVFLWRGLQLDPSHLPSPLIDKEAPVISVATLPASDEPFTNDSMVGEVWVFNVWASWCVSCIQEHPLLVSLSENFDVPIVGLNYKDTPSDATGWLERFGNPYAAVLDDRDGSVGIDWGVYGVPETFVIDHLGRVRYKHVGALDSDDIQDTLIPVVEKLQAEML